jgi:phosphoribosylformylglycinamidine synthase
MEQGRPPEVDLAAEARLADLLRSLVAKGYLRTAHDLSDGGFLIALAESCLGRRLGARVEVPLVGADLFSESQGRAIVACSPAALDRVLQAAEELGVAAREIGEVGGDALEVRTGGEIFKAPIAGLHEIWTTALPRALGL